MGGSRSSTTIRPTTRDLFVLESGIPIPLVVTDADEAPAVFFRRTGNGSRNSDESGGSEAMRDFAPERVPAVGRQAPSPPTAATSRAGAETEGGVASLDGHLMAVSIAMGQTFAVGVPVALFEVRVLAASFPTWHRTAASSWTRSTVDPPIRRPE
jgi:hypothetical protein